MDANEARATWDDIMAAPAAARYGMFLSALEREGEDEYAAGVGDAAGVINQSKDEWCGEAWTALHEAGQAINALLAPRDRDGEGVEHRRDYCGPPELEPSDLAPPQEPPAYQFSNEPRRPFPRPPSEGLDIAAGGARHFTPPQEPKPQPGRCPHGKSDPVKCRRCAFPGDDEGGGDGSDR